MTALSVELNQLSHTLKIWNLRQQRQNQELLKIKATLAAINLAISKREAERPTLSPTEQAKFAIEKTIIVNQLTVVQTKIDDIKAERRTFDAILSQIVSTLHYISDLLAKIF